eukprot:3651545-Pyramimonas_sp.AAC.1
MNATPAPPQHYSVIALKVPALFATDAANYRAAASDERRAQAAAAARRAFQEQRQLRGDRWRKRVNAERGKGELWKPFSKRPVLAGIRVPRGTPRALPKDQMD